MFIISLALIITVIILILILIYILAYSIYISIFYFKLKEILNSIIITNNKITRFYHLLQDDDLINFIYEKDYFNNYIKKLKEIDHKYIQFPNFIYSTHLYYLAPDWKLLNNQSINFKHAIKKCIKIKKISLKEFNYIYKNTIKLKKLNKKITLNEEILIYNKNDFSKKRELNKLIDEKNEVEKNLRSFFKKIKILKEVI